MVTPHDERRHFTRVLFDTPVLITSADGHSWQGKVLDLSLKGALLQCPPDWRGKSGDRFIIKIHLEGGAAVITMEVSVTHIEKDHAGFRCEHIDVDSITHLRRLMELNMGDVELLNRELQHLA